MRRASLLALLCLSLVGLGACGRSDDSPKVTTHNNGTQTFTVTDDKGTKVTVAGPGASADTPAYAPLFPGATVESSVTTSDKGGIVAFKTTAPPQAVIAFYKKSAATVGFKDNLDMTTGDTMSYSASNESHEHSLNVVAAQNEDGTHVQLTWN